LEAHVLDSSNVLCALEVFTSPVFSPLPCVVYKVLGNFTESAAFLTEVDDDSATTLLCFLDSFLDTESEVWTACADVRAKHVTAVALIVNTQREATVGIRHLRWVAEDVDCETADRGQEDLDVGTSDQLRV
jgi:hypothetical protein